MLAEIVQLNKVYKGKGIGNDFTYIRPRMHHDRLIYVLEAPSGKQAPKIANALQRIKPEAIKDEDSLENLLKFFNIDKNIIQIEKDKQVKAMG